MKNDNNQEVKEVISLEMEDKNQKRKKARDCKDYESMLMDLIRDEVKRL